MNNTDFDRAIEVELGSHLRDLGFSSEGSQYCTFHRKFSEEIYHFVIPDISTDGTWFDVRVFGHSPRIDPLFYERFPDSLGIPSGSVSFLHDLTGVGPDQKRYRCRTKDGLIRNVRTEVLPAIHTHAIPYLNKITSLRELRQVTFDSFYKAVLDLILNSNLSAADAAKLEIERLERLDTSDKIVRSNINFIRSLL
jgi:hypothetical protein